MASDCRNRITTSEGITKEQVASLSFRESFSDPPEIIGALRCG